MTSSSLPNLGFHDVLSHWSLISGSRTESPSGLYVFTQESFEGRGCDFCVVTRDFALKTTEVFILLRLLE